ncbi:MAG: low molecular weight protein arginine phosphatase [Candidatus Omnitrophota bacterium]
MKNAKHVLFVCTGNSCRSIMAEAYLKKRAKEEGLSIEVMSAGTYGMEGMMLPQETVQILRKESIDPAGYGSKPITAKLILWADIILVMEPAHRSRIIEKDAEAAGKTYLLGDFNKADGILAIPDPIGRPLAFYRTSFNLIKRSIEGFMVWLKK